MDIVQEDKEFWNNVKDWTNPTVQHAKFLDNTPLHKEIYEECQKYNKWTNILSKDFSDELIFNLSVLSGPDSVRDTELDKRRREAHHELQERWKISYNNNWEYYHTVPKEKDFPTVIQYIKDNPQFSNPVLTKLGANEKILVHLHVGEKSQFHYNMAINEPEGSKMAIYPTGIIPYNAGDMYRLYVNNNHAVINGNQDRFHLMLKHKYDGYIVFGHYEFWNKIDEWTDNSQKGVGAEFHDSVSNHEEMYQECVRYQDWIHATTEPNNVSEDLVNITKVGFEDAPNMKWDGDKFVSADGIWPRWFAIPDKDNFPTIYKFLEKNKHQYRLPVISKLGPGATILPHRHIGQTHIPFLYNMCLNFPEGCRFAIYPTGLVPYKAGDIYKLHVHTCVHSVINNSTEDRFHLMLRGIKNV